MKKHTRLISLPVVAALLLFMVNCKKEDPLPALSTLSATSIAGTYALSGGDVTSEGGESILSRGVVWSTGPDPTVEQNTGLTQDEGGMGRFESSITGLEYNTTYYVRAYATNQAGTSYGQSERFTTLERDYPFDTETRVVDVLNPITGKIWMDRNLGASRAATGIDDEEAYGHLYQWGRAADGHQIRTSDTTRVLSSSDTPGHGDFILAYWETRDWRNPQNKNLWDGEKGINNPCPPGYRLPTIDELREEHKSWSSQDPAGAFGSPLKLVGGGKRYYANGEIQDIGYGTYWASTPSISGGSSTYLLFSPYSCGTFAAVRGPGDSVRCIKD